GRAWRRGMGRARIGGGECADAGADGTPIHARLRRRSRACAPSPSGYLPPMRHYDKPRPAGRLLALLLVVAGCATDDGRTPVVVYSPHGRELLETFEAQFEEANPDIDIQWLDMGSQEVLDRLRSERANPQADVWWGAPSPMFVTATGQDLLAPFSPSWAGALPADSKD